MARYFLKHFQIEGFRGINNEGDPLDLAFDTGGVNSLFAVNAHGKSSLFEALAYAIKGVVPKLERLPASEDAGSYYANRFHSGGKATMSLTLLRSSLLSTDKLAGETSSRTSENACYFL